MTSTSDDRQYSPATQRNREPILEVLRQVLPSTGTVLEISSGTGEHAVFFAPQLRPRFWQPSDPSAIARSSITAWRTHHPCDTLLRPLSIDTCDSIWSVEQQELPEPIAAIVNINMIHISPWAACLGLMAGANRILPPGGILYLYGPYKRNGVHTAPSNEFFDDSLQQQNPAWGVRNLEDVIEAAAVENLKFLDAIAMPANNLSVIFQK